MSTTVIVDTKDLKRSLKDVRIAIRKIAPMMLGEVVQAAVREQSSHAYQNRTGTLEASTRGYLSRNDSVETEASLEMGADYASYIVDKGLSNIVEEAELTESILQDYFSHMLDKA